MVHQDPQLLGRDFRLPQLAFLEDGMRRIPEGSHPGDLRQDLLEQFQLLPDDLGGHRA